MKNNNIETLLETMKTGATSPQLENLTHKIVDNNTKVFVQGTIKGLYKISGMFTFHTAYPQHEVNGTFSFDPKTLTVEPLFDKTVHNPNNSYFVKALTETFVNKIVPSLPATIKTYNKNGTTYYPHTGYLDKNVETKFFQNPQNMKELVDGAKTVHKTFYQIIEDSECEINISTKNDLTMTIRLQANPKLNYGVNTSIQKTVTGLKHEPLRKNVSYIDTDHLLKGQDSYSLFTVLFTQILDSSIINKIFAQYVSLITHSKTDKGKHVAVVDQNHVMVDENTEHLGDCFLEIVNEEDFQDNITITKDFQYQFVKTFKTNSNNNDDGSSTPIVFGGKQNDRQNIIVLDPRDETGVNLKILN